MIFVGIDPGANGGIAVLDQDGGVLVAIKMPDTDRGILDALSQIALPGASRAALEQVHTMPKQGIVSAFTFGAGFGGLKMALAATGIPYDLITPLKWQTAMQCRTRGDKNVSKARAQQLFPAVKITHAIADALLIAEFCRRWYTATGTP